MPNIARRRRRQLFFVVACPIAALVCGWLSGSLTAAGAAPGRPAQNVAPTVPRPNVPTPTIPRPDTATPTTGKSDGSISIDLGGLDGTGKKKPGQSIVIILLLTVIAVAPALLVMVTSFTRIVIVLSLTRNALGLASIPRTRW